MISVIVQKDIRLDADQEKVRVEMSVHDWKYILRQLRTLEIFVRNEEA